MYRNLIKTISNKYNKIRNYLSVSLDDIILASYPRSGSTWLRFIISNIIKSYLDLPSEIDFYTIEKTFPDIHQKRFSKTNESIKTYYQRLA